MSSRSTLTAPPSNQLTADQRWTLVLASVGSFLVIVDLFAVTTALPALRVALHASITTLDWTINAYTLSFAVLLMTAAALGDRWGRRRVYASGLLGVALVALLAWQRRASQPLIPLRLFTDTAFASGIAGIFLQSASLTALVFFTAQFLQDAQGDSPLVAGLRLLPLGLVALALGPWSGTSADRVGTRPMIVTGMTLQTAGTIIPAIFSRPGLWYPIPAVAMAVVAVGFTFALPALTKSVVGSVEPADIGTASGLFSTVRQVGAAFGVAATSAAFTATGGYPTASGYRGAMIVAAVLAGLGTATTAMSRRAASRASAVPRG